MFIVGLLQVYLMLVVINVVCVIVDCFAYSIICLFVNSGFDLS